MRLKYILLLIILKSFNGYSQAPGDTITLKGYFIVYSAASNSIPGCTLDIPSLDYIFGDKGTCGDRAYYKNIAFIHFIEKNDLALYKIDDFSYRVSIQKNSYSLIMSINPSILLETNKGNPSILKNKDLVERIKLNNTTAELFQQQVQPLNLSYNGGIRKILMEGVMKAIVLPDRPEPTTAGNPLNVGRFALMYDKANYVKTIKVIKSNF